MQRERIDVPAPDVTENYVRMRQRDPGEFEDDSLRTITLNERDGIRAVIGKLKGETSTTVQSYLFDRSKGWTSERAKAWVKKQSGRYKTREFLSRATAYAGDADLRVIAQGTTFRLESRSEWECLSEVLELDAFKARDERTFDHVEHDENGVPTAFRIVEFGDWSTSKYGTLKVTQRTAKGTMAWWAYKWGDEKIPMDWSHKSADGTDERSPGYWKPEIREDGIWAAEIEWTEDGYEVLRKKQVKFFSPEGAHIEKTGEVLAITYIALTNRPATNHMKPLVASDTAQVLPPQERKMKELLKRLGLAETATEEEAIAKFDELTKASEETHKAAMEAKDAEIVTLKAKADDKLAVFKAETLKACSLGEDAGFEKVLATIETLKAKAPEADKVAKLEAKMAEYEAFREGIRVEKLLASVSTKVVPANKATVERLARALDEATFLATMKDWPDIKGPSPVPASSKTIDERNEDISAHEVLTDADRSFFAAKGWDPKTEAGKKEIADFIAARLG